MIQSRRIARWLRFILMCVLVVSCASDELPTSTPQLLDLTVREVPDATTVGSLAEEASADSGEAATAAENKSSDEPVYPLNWELGQDEIVAYRTAMNQVDDAGSSFSVDFDQLFADDQIPDEVRQQLSGISLPESFSMISILERNQRDNISVKMIVHEVDVQEGEPGDEMSEAFNEMMGGMEGTVQLRGELTPEGAVASFYLEERQRNLVAMFFELPTEPVSVSDSWAIDVNCIDLGHGFIVSSAERVNRVEFTELTETADGELVAVLDYAIAESVEGVFQVPFSEEAVPTAMTCTYLAQGLFLVEEGRWEQLTGEFAIKGTGLVNSDVVQFFALTPLEDIPTEYLGIE